LRNETKGCFVMRTVICGGVHCDAGVQWMTRLPVASSPLCRREPRLLRPERWCIPLSLCTEIFLI